MNLGVPGQPHFIRDATDRNRTSPVAFTGNKFEFRAVGASQNVGRSCTTLNAILADSLRYVADEVEKGLAAGGKSVREVAEDVLRATFIKHQAIIFEGNGYSQEWRDEAKKRGLPIHATTADVLPVTTSDKNVALFTSLNIFSKEELEARQIIDAGEYVTKIASEAAATVGLFNNFAAPAGFETQTKIASAIIAANNAVTGTDQKSQSKALAALSKSLSTGLEAAADLQSRLDALNEDSSSPLQRAALAKASILPGLRGVRAAADEIESAVPHSSWHLPSYHEMLFHQD